MQRNTWRAALAASLCLGVLVPGAAAQVRDRTGEVAGTPSVVPGDCTGLAGLRLVNTSIGSVTAVQNSKSYFCRVAGVARPTRRSYINFEVWLPAPERWNGKLYSGAGGSARGAILQDTLQKGMDAGYAAMSQDRGHAGRDSGDGRWAAGNPEKIVDWGHRAQHVTTVATKNIVRAYYGKPPQRSYFESCSTGGQVSLMEAERYPEDYDGVIAAAPAWRITHAQATLLWAGHPSRLGPESRLLPRDKLTLLHNAVLRSCDALDGATDGLIAHPFGCRFDPAELQCRSGEGADCLTAEQVRTAGMLYSGPMRPDGRNIAPGYPRGSELGWATYMAGSRPSMVTDYFQYWINESAKYDVRTFDFDRDWDRTNAKMLKGESMARAVNTDGNLEAYRRRGGKVLLWIGGADTSASPAAAALYHDAVVKHVGAGAVDEVLRMFVAPGVAHCGGGQGPDRFDMLKALEEWVEQGKAPERIIATRMGSDGKVARTLPLCVHPKYPRYTGTGDINAADNYACANP